jgi:hypothetical protein
MEIAAAKQKTAALAEAGRSIISDRKQQQVQQETSAPVLAG